MRRLRRLWTSASRSTVLHFVKTLRTDTCFQNIDDDCLQIILSFIGDRKDLLSLSRASRRFYDPCQRIVYAQWTSDYSLAYPLPEKQNAPHTPPNALRFIKYRLGFFNVRNNLITS